ncbi:MAG: hypothetical protein AB8B48_11255 [Pseudomonadales bacterium]
MSNCRQWRSALMLLLIMSGTVLEEGKLGRPESLPFANDSDVPAKV